MTVISGRIYLDALCGVDSKSKKDCIRVYSLHVCAIQHVMSHNLWSCAHTAVMDYNFHLQSQVFISLKNAHCYIHFLSFSVFIYCTVLFL